MCTVCTCSICYLQYYLDDKYFCFFTFLSYISIIPEKIKYMTGINRAIFNREKLEMRNQTDKTSLRAILIENHCHFTQQIRKYKNRDHQKVV